MPSGGGAGRSKRGERTGLQPIGHEIVVLRDDEREPIARRPPVAFDDLDGVMRAGLERKRIHQPAEHEGGRDEAGEHQAAEPDLLARVVSGDDGEDERDEEGEQHQQDQVALQQVPLARHFFYHFRPTATS